MTGQLCHTPKIRNEILEGVDSESVKQLAVEAVESSCDHETHPDDWFEDPGSGYGTPGYWRTQRAKARCFNDCPIRLQCLNNALGSDQVHGIWGGYTADQREKIRDHRQLWLTGRINEQEGKLPAPTQRKGGSDAKEESEDTSTSAGQ